MRRSLLYLMILAAFISSAHAALESADVAAAPPEHRAAMQFLIDNMPAQDRENLTPDFLLENVALAYQARNANSWAKAIPEELFFNAVLPYASINEHRDNWRRDFASRFGPLVKDCKSAGEAALVLNKSIFKILNVTYHATKRPKPDQSPFESIAAGYASCSGLSILLIDACRAVGVPARFVGTPSWTTGKGDANGNHGGNHSWVEIWDGQWHVLGAIEVSPLDETWFLDNASKADPAQPVHCIYATSFKNSGLTFPLVWNAAIDWVPAEDVTQTYLRRTPVKIQALNAGGDPVTAHLILRLKDQLIADCGLRNSPVLILSAAQEYEGVLTGERGDYTTVKFAAPTESNQIVSLLLQR